MTTQDVFILAMRWVHVLAALVWIGGSLFYALVLQPTRRKTQDPQVAHFNRALAQEFRSWVILCIGVLIVSGAILTLTRLNSGFTTLPYILVLSLHSLLAIIAFLLVRAQMRRRPISPLSLQSGSPISEDPTASSQSQWAKLRSFFSNANLILATGIAAYLLADILRYLVEYALKGD